MLSGRQFPFFQRERPLDPPSQKRDRKFKRTFKGGYRFENLAGSPEPTLREVSIPDKVIIPLQQGFAKEVMPIVKIGERIKAGQIIGTGDNSSPVHASVNGSVKNICTIKLRGKDVSAVVIESDGSRDWMKSDLTLTDFKDRDPNEIRKALYLSGVASLGRYGFPTEYNTSPLQPNNADSLIINAIYSEPYALSNKILLKGNVTMFLTGLEILRHALDNRAEVYIGINNQDKEIIKEITSCQQTKGLSSTSEWLHICPLPPVYPQDHDLILTETILNREATYGGSITDMQTVVMDVQAVLHAYEAVVEGKPVIERIVALGGSVLSKSLFLKVRVGTPFSHAVGTLANPTENRYIHGGLMTGMACDDLSTPIDRSVSSLAVLPENRGRQFLSFLRPGIDRESFSNAFLSSLFPMVKRRVDTNLNGEQRPCIYCNYCESVCPVGLMPYLLSKYVTHNMLDSASKHKILKCIDCGLCTYICPSKIPLMDDIQGGKAQLLGTSN